MLVLNEGATLLSHLHNYAVVQATEHRTEIALKRGFTLEEDFTGDGGC